MTRIYVLFADEPVFHPGILGQLLVRRPEEIVGVGGVSHRRGNERKTAYYRKQIEFWGHKGFLVNASAVGARRLADRLPLPTALGFHSLRSVCAAHGTDYRIVEDVNDPAYLAQLRESEPDVIVSSQGQLFQRALLELPRLGCINRHSALLPAYGGLKPVFWAMLAGERKVGVSVHRMEDAIDQGDVLAQISVPATGKSLYQLYKDVFAVSGEAILHAIAVLEGTTSPAAAESEAVPSYFGEPRADDIRRFRDLGHRMA